MQIEDFLTHVSNEEDEVYLHSLLFDVNMRLFNNKNNPAYRRIVQGMCNYLARVATTEMKGYKKPHGMSGANIGIPLNIIAIVRNRGQQSEKVEVMINPKITSYSGDKVLSESNCGSIRLKEPIMVERFPFISLDWYNTDGVKQYGNFERATGAFTIQHEVDHNLGVLITDKEVKYVKT